MAAKEPSKRRGLNLLTLGCPDWVWGTWGPAAALVFLQKDIRLTQGRGCAVLLVSEEVRMPAGWDCCWGRFGGKEGWQSDLCGAGTPGEARPSCRAVPSSLGWLLLGELPTACCSIP